MVKEHAEIMIVDEEGPVVRISFIVELLAKIRCPIGTVE
jgi:hypothetical protein